VWEHDRQVDDAFDEALAGELLAGMKAMLCDPAELRRRGMEGQKRVLASRGAAERYAGMILKALKFGTQDSGIRNRD